MTSDQAIQAITAAKSTIASNWNAYRVTRMTTDEHALVESTSAALPAANAAVDELERLLRAGDTAGLDRFVRTDLYPAIDPVSANMAKLVDLQVRVAREDGVEAAGVFKIAMIVMALIALAAVGLLIFATHVIVKRVSTPLQAMTGAMLRLADGDHGIVVPAVGQRDELGQMADAVVVFRDAAVAKIKADVALVEAKAKADHDQRIASETAIAEQQALVVQSFGVALDRLAQGDLTYHVNDSLPVEYEKLRSDFNAAMAAFEGHDVGRRDQCVGHPLGFGRDQPRRRRPVATHRATGRQPGGNRRRAGSDHRHRQPHRSRRASSLRYSSGRQGRRRDIRRHRSRRGPSDGGH